MAEPITTLPEQLFSALPSDNPACAETDIKSARTAVFCAFNRRAAIELDGQVFHAIKKA